MSTSTETGTDRTMTGTAEWPPKRSSVHSAGSRPRAIGLVLLLVVCGGLMIRWASRRQRRSGSPARTDLTSRLVEGGI